MIDLKKLSDVQSVVDSLSGLPKEALFYIAGYAEGWRDKPKKKRRKSNGENGAPKGLKPSPEKTNRLTQHS